MSVHGDVQETARQKHHIQSERFTPKHSKGQRNPLSLPQCRQQLGRDEFIVQIN